MNGMSVMSNGTSLREGEGATDPNSTPARANVSKMYVFSVLGGTSTLS